VSSIAAGDRAWSQRIIAPIEDREPARFVSWPNLAAPAWAGRAARRNAASGQRPEDQQDFRTTIRSPRFWVTLLILLVINWLLVPLPLSEPQDRVSVPYTFFKQQVASG